MSALTPPEVLRRLVGFDTTSHRSNLELVEFIADALDRPGVRIHRQHSPDGTKANLVISLGPEADPATREGLVLSGHMDVVPALEPEWESDPFRLREDSDRGRFFGRGACDMKGFLALAVARTAALDPQSLRRPLALLFTYDEEVGTLGAREFVDHWEGSEPLPRRTIIGEPTGLRAVRLHKGHLKARITLHGRSAHSGHPRAGDNAIEPMATVISALVALRRTLEEERPAWSEFFGDVPFVTLNVGEIHGGSAINVVPDRCRLDLGVRLLPGMEGADMMERIRRSVSDALADRPFRLDLLGESPPLLQSDSGDLYRAVCQAVGQAGTASVYFATDAGWLQAGGFECVICGPGNMDVAHRPNEWIAATELERGAAVLDGLIDRFCMADLP